MQRHDRVNILAISLPASPILVLSVTLFSNSLCDVCELAAGNHPFLCTRHPLIQCPIVHTHTPDLGVWVLGEETH